MSEPFTAAACCYFDGRAIDRAVAAEVGVIERGRCIVWPTRDVAGDPLPRRRRLDWTQGARHKVTQPADRSPAPWWPLGRPDQAPNVLVCEGEPDALAAVSAFRAAPEPLRIPVVAMPGSSTPPRRLAGELIGCGCREAIFAVDSDQAGDELVARAAGELRAVGIAIVRVSLGEGHDLADELANVAGERGVWLANRIADAQAAADSGAPADLDGECQEVCDRLALTWASDVPPQRVRWLERQRIPLGNVSLLVGEEGLGKSQVLTDLAARVTRGELDGDLRGLPATVLIASAEDALAEVIVPRLIAAEADLSRVAFVAVEGDGLNGSLALPDDVDAIARRARETGARLLIVDPLVAYIPTENSTHRDQHVRRVLAPLARLSETCDLATSAVVHLNKSETQRVLARVGGSVAFTAAARSVLMLGRDPDDPDPERGSRRVLAHAKSNYGPLAPSLALRIEGREVRDNRGGMIPTSRAVVLGECESSADDLVRHRDADDRSASDEAGTFLRHLLADGPVPAKEARAAANENGISDRTLDRAKRRLGVKSRRPGGEGSWYWTLDEGESSKLGRQLGSQTPSKSEHSDLGDLAPTPAVEPGLDRQSKLDRQGGTFMRAHVPAREAASSAPGSIGSALGPDRSNGARPPLTDDVNQPSDPDRILSEDESVERLIEDFDAVELPSDDDDFVQESAG